jgi:hypothetical protein
MTAARPRDLTIEWDDLQWSEFDTVVMRMVQDTLTYPPEERAEIGRLRAELVEAAIEVNVDDLAPEPHHDDED